MASTYSDEQLQKILQMQDFATEEMKLQQQMAAANQLRARGMDPSSGPHWTRQAARGLQGIAGAVGDYKNWERMDELSKQKRAFIQGQGPGAVGSLRSQNNPNRYYEDIIGLNVGE